MQSSPSGNDAGGKARTSMDASASSTATETSVNTTVTCRPTGAEGPVIEELAVAGDMPPPLGGEIKSGTYVLSLLQFYPGGADAGGTTGLDARKTLVLDSMTYRLTDAEGTDDAGLGAPQITGGTYSVAEKTLTRSQECPTLASVANGYSAAGSQLGIYRGAHFEVYELQTPP